MKKLLSLVVILLLPVLAEAQGIVGKDGDTSALWDINVNGVLQASIGKSARVTYVASSSALVTTADYNLSIESSAGSGFTLLNFCVGWTSATAAAGITIGVNRRTTASSGGVALTIEGTGADSISRMDLGDTSYGGIARRTGTLGAIGPTLFQTSRMVGEIGAGAADPTGGGPFCYDFTRSGQKAPTVAAGIALGISITVTAPGAGGLAFGSISATITVP